MIRPKFGEKYQKPVIKSKSDEFYKARKKQLQLINKRKSSHELLRLEIEKSKNLRKHKRPNRFYELARRRYSIDAEHNYISHETNRKSEEFRKEEKNSINEIKNNFMRGRNNPMGDASNMIYELKSENGGYHKEKRFDLVTEKGNSKTEIDSAIDQTDSESSIRLIEISTRQDVKKEYKKIKKYKNTNHNLKSNSKIMNIIRIFTIEKLCNIKNNYNNNNNNQNINANHIRKYNNKANLFNIIYTVKKYSPMFTEKEKNNFLKRVITPITKRKLRNRYTFDLKRKKNKTSLIPSTQRINSTLNKQKYERLQRLINFRIKLNTCLEYYYNIRPENNDYLMKIWVIFRNVKFNLLDKKQSLDSIYKENLNSKVKRQMCWNNNYRIEKPFVFKSLSESKLRKTQSFPQLVNNILVKIESSTCISNESLKKFVRTNKIINKDDNDWIENPSEFSLSDVDVRGNQSLPSDLLIQRRLSGFFERKKPEKPDKKEEELPLINKMYTPRFLTTKLDDNINREEYDIRYFNSTAAMNEEEMDSETNLPASFPVIKGKTPTCPVKCMMADLEKRIKNSKAIHHPIKSTITDFTIHANKTKITEPKLKMKSVHPVRNNLTVTIIPDLNKTEHEHEKVQQIYKNPNFNLQSPRKEKGFTNFIERNKQLVTVESKRIQEKIKCNRPNTTANFKKHEMCFVRNKEITERGFNKQQKNYGRRNLRKTNSVKTLYVNDKNKLKEKDSDKFFLPLVWREDSCKNYPESEDGSWDCDEENRQKLSPSKSILSNEIKDASYSELDSFEEYEIKDINLTDSTLVKSKKQIEENEYWEDDANNLGNPSKSDKNKNISPMLYDENARSLKSTREHIKISPSETKYYYKSKSNLEGYSLSDDKPLFNSNRELARTSSYTKYEDEPLFDKNLKSVSYTIDTDKVLQPSCTSEEKRVSMDTILKKIEESCKRFQNMKEDEIAILQNLILERSRRAKSDSRTLVYHMDDADEKFENISKISNPLKNIEDQWENEMKMSDQSNRSSDECTSILSDDSQSKTNHEEWINEMKIRLENCNEKLGKSESNHSKNCIKDWPNEFIHHSKKTPSNWTNDISNELIGEDRPTKWVTASTRKEKNHEKNQISSSLLTDETDKYLPQNGYDSEENDNDSICFNDFQRNSMDESSVSSYPTDSEDEKRFDCRPSSDWLIPEVFNVKSSGCDFYQRKFIDNETKKDKKTRLQEYLKRFNFDVDMSPKITNQKSTPKISIFPPLIE